MRKFKNVLTCVMMTTLVISMTAGITACGSKRSKGKTASDGNLEAETTSEVQTEIKLEFNKGQTLTDENGKKIDVAEGETVEVVEKTTDAKGDTIYVLDNGARIKADDVKNVASEKVETVTTKSVLNNQTGKKNTESKTNAITSASQVNKKQQVTTGHPETPKSTNITQKPTTQPASVPTPAPTEAPKPTTAQPETPKPTEAPKPVPTPAPTPTEAPKPTEPPTTVASYTGYRTDLENIAKTNIINLRNSEAGATKNPTWNEHLYKVAQARVRELVNDFSHDSAGNYRSGYNICEACTMWTHDARDNNPIEGWIDSPEHHFIITTGDQYAVAFYQDGRFTYGVCLTGDEIGYIAENCASIGALDWGQPGTPKYEEKYKKYYNAFVEDHGERKIW